jgi:hypothetical protein
MNRSYLNIPEGNKGYASILRAFRTEIPLATKEDYPGIKCVVNGNLPEEIEVHLPIFGSSDSGAGLYALNSGGRGVILSDGKVHIRFKGNDIDGSLTRRVAQSGKNHIPDIGFAAKKIAGLEFYTTCLSGDNIYILPTYSGKPFSFFTPEAVEREKNACNLIGSAFEKQGFFKPYSFEGSITYPNVQWNNEPCSTLAFSLPSIESDLRFEEIFRLGFLHLKFASPEELKDIKDDLGDFFRELTSWHGFVTQTMEANHLVPTLDSHQHQNYVLCHISDTELGASRVDHTSTRVNQNQSKEYAGMMREELLFFANLHLTLLHALELADQKYHLDENRYTGYFDRAYKWHGQLNFLSIPGVSDYIRELTTAFKEGFQGNPTPVPEQKLIDIVTDLGQIKMDEERQRRVTQFQLRSLPKLFQP